MIDYNIDVYLRHTEMENMYVRELIELVTNDYNGNVFNFTIYDKDQSPYDLTGKTVTLIVNSELGTVIEEGCTITEATSGKATLTVPSDMFCEKGTYYAEIQIWQGLNRITSLPFDYTVRLSMDSNEAVKADNRFSLLQQALKDVSDSNAIAAEAKTTAESALAKSNQAVTTIDSQVSKVNTAASSANTALDRATSVITQEELANKIGHNGIFDDTNFNFMGNGVAPDGLVGLAQKELKTFNISSNYDFDVILRLTGVDSIVGGSYPYLVNSDRKIVLFLYVQNTLSFAYTPKGGSIINVHSNVPVKDGDICVFSRQENSIRVWLNGVLVIKTEVENLQQYDTITTGSYGGGYKLNDWLLLYNRQLEPQEIQHNISTLNNSPSISHLNTTDVDGNVKKFAIATDSHHVEARGGRTQDKINQVFYAQNGKEFVADETGKIEVNNGLEGWVNKAEITGQTVKNIQKYDQNEGFITPASGLMKIDNSISGYTKWEKSSSATVSSTYVAMYNSVILEPNKKYYLSVFCLGNKPLIKTTAQDFAITTSPSTYISQKGKTSFATDGKANVFEFTTGASFTKVSGVLHTYIACNDANIAVGDWFAIRYIITDTAPINDIMPFGLNSTQAIISNNGMNYAFYEPNITGKTRILKALKGTQNWVEIDVNEARDTAKFDYKLDSVAGDLGSVSNVSDYVDRGRKVKALNTKEAILNGSESGWVVGNTGNSNYYYQLPLPFSTKANGLSNNYVFTSIGNSDLNQGFYITSNSLLRIRFGTEKSLSDFKKELSLNNLVIRTELATPIEAPLTNEQVKEYDAFKKLISLPSAEDKVILNEDGSGSYIQDKFRYIFNDTDSWKMDSRTPLQNTLLFHIILANLSSNKNNLNAIPNVLNPNLMYSVDAEGIYTDSGILYVRVLKSKLPSQDLLGFKEWAQSVNFYVWLQLAAPIITYIPKEITPTILTNKINILEVKSPVAPSSFKATLPINKNAEQDAEIQNLKDRLNTIMNVLYANPLLVNTYIDQEVQESQKAINERMM